MDSIQDKLAQDFYSLAYDYPSTATGVLTHDEVRAILSIVRRLKTRLEVLDAEMENDI